jgi:PAS domain S-box-containing protein
MAKPLRVLIVEDSEDDCQLMVRELRRGGFGPKHLRVETSVQFKAALASGRWDAILSDFSLPGYSGLEVIRELRESGLDLPCIIVSGAIGEDAAVSAIRDGAHDYVMKDRLARLPLAVEQQLAETAARRERKRMEDEVQRSNAELAALQAVAVAISRSLDLQKVLEAALEETLRVLSAEAGAVFLSDQTGGTRSPIVNRGFSKQVLDSIAEMMSQDVLSPDPSGARLLRMEEDSPCLSTHLITEGWSALMVVTLQTKQGDEGFVLAGSRQRDALKRETLPLAIGIGRQISVAVENARLHEQVRARTRYLETLQMINARIRSTLPLQEVLHIITENAARVVDGVASMSFIPNTEGERLELGAIFGHSMASAALKFTGKTVQSCYIPISGNHPASRAYREGKLQKWSGGIDKLAGDSKPQVDAEVFSLIDAAVGAKSGACLPMLAGDKTVGVLIFFSPRTALSGQEQLMLTGLADQGGLAIESARLFEETQRLKAFNESIVQGVAEAIFIQDDRGVLTFVNPAAEALLGIPAAELKGRSWDRLGTVASPEGQEGDSLSPLSVKRYEAELLDSSGQAIPVIVSARPLKLEGRSAGILSACTDISDRIRAERLLLALNRAALSMAQAMTHEETFAAVARECRSLGWPCVLLLFDPDRQALQVRYLSYDEDLIATIRQAIGRSPTDIEIPTAKVAEEWARLSQGETVVIRNGAGMLEDIVPGIDFSQAAKIAELMGFSGCITAPLITNSSVIGVFTVASSSLRERDIPAIAALANQIAAAWHKIDLLLLLRKNLQELKELQNQLIHAQKMEAVGRLAGAVAHDFNNHLTVMIGNAELLFENSGRDERLRREIEEILNTAQRSAQLTQQLLAFSRKQVIQPVILNPKQLVGKIEPMLRRLIGEDIELALCLSSDTGWIHADPGQMEQVIMNLAVNARDAMPQGGKLSIEAKNVTVEQALMLGREVVAPGHYVLIAISDDGTGMDAQTMDHLFEPFFTTKPAGVGTGLGLAIVYGIVRQSEGTIIVDSTLGQGSTFTIYLPRVEPRMVESVEQNQVEPPRGRGERILLVEDELPLCHLLEQALEQNGYGVLAANDSDEAIKIAEGSKEPFHVLLTDVVMPGTVPRKAMVERIVCLHPEIRVILMSGYTDEAIVRHGVLEPGRRFLAKPFSMVRLLESVRNALDNR